jgi:hypothetical protein
MNSSHPSKASAQAKRVWVRKDVDGAAALPSSGSGSVVADESSTSFIVHSVPYGTEEKEQRY